MMSYKEEFILKIKDYVYADVEITLIEKCHQCIRVYLTWIKNRIGPLMDKRKIEIENVSDAPMIRIGDRSLVFKRSSDKIEVNQYIGEEKVNLDNFRPKRGQIFSERMEIPFSEDLIDEYLKVTFDCLFE